MIPAATAESGQTKIAVEPYRSAVPVRQSDFGTLVLAREQGRPADSVLTELLATFDHRDPDLV